MTNVAPTERGKRNRRYTEEERVKILRAVADKANGQAAERAREALAKTKSVSATR